MDTETTTPAGHRSGFVAIVGRPNAGKSTLINRLVSYKVSIVSRRPQTTRNRIAGIRSDERSQIVFVDTPGVHHSEQALNQYMMDQVRSALEDVDVILYLKDATARTDNLEDDRATMAMIAPVSVPKLAAINKVDRLRRGMELPLIAELAELNTFEELFPISALDGEGVDGLVDAIVARLPEGPRYFPEDQVTDVTERFIVSEIIRERVFHLLHQEVPYSTAVEVEQYEELTAKNLVRIHACIHVERDSQKGIIIGKGGSMLKAIGQQAREEIERLLGCQVYLKLFVRVDENWTRNPRVLRQLGYGRS